MFSYRKIVFGIKQKYRISDILKILKHQHYCSFLISEHNAMDGDNCCERCDVHYHGVVEFNDGEGKGGISLMQLSPFCTYLKNDHCSNPAEYLAYITLEPKRIIDRVILESSKLADHLQIASNMKFDIMKKKEERKFSLIVRNNDITKLISFLLKFGNYGNSVLSKYKQSEPRCAWFQRWIEENMETVQNITQKNIDTAMSISLKIVLNSSILDLSKRFELQDGYLSPEASAEFVMNWCSYQNLDPQALIKNLIRCLDKRSGNRNSIYFQGSANSGKTYIVQSVIDACIHVGQVMVESSAYAFVWEKCADKRLIVLKEPHFSKINIDQLDKVLSGSGTLIYKHNDVVDYLSPTPVIILANENDWMSDPQLSDKIKKRFLCCHMGLKNFPQKYDKKLHPQWLSLLHKKFTGKNVSKVDQPGDMKVRSQSSKTGADNLLTTNSPMNSNQGSENMMQPNLKYRKRPKSCVEQDGGKSKMEADEDDIGRIGKVLKMSCSHSPNIESVPKKSIEHNGERTKCG